MRYICLKIKLSNRKWLSLVKKSETYAFFCNTAVLRKLKRNLRFEIHVMCVVHAPAEKSKVLNITI